jgi:Myb/SANT-like DNA-binding domain
MENSFKSESKFFKNDIKPRGPRTSKSQYETYVKFLEDHPKFARSVICEAYNGNDRDRDWETLGKLMNGCQGANKTTKQWQECLYDWRKKMSMRYRRSTANKNGPIDPNTKPVELSELDVRTLKALGKWTDEDTYNTNPQLHYDCDMTNFEDEGGDEDYSNNSESYQDIFEAAPKTEPLEDPIVVFPERSKKRKLQDDEEEASPEPSKHSKVIEENTKAIRNQTAALMTLSDSITSLTSTIRSYMYSKNSD